VFVAVGVDDRFQLVAELWFTSASIDGLELGLFGSVQYLADELLVRRVDVQMRQGGGRYVSTMNVEVVENTLADERFSRDSP